MATTEAKKTAEVLPEEGYATLAELSELEARLAVLENTPGIQKFKATTDPHNPVWKGYVHSLQGHVNG